MANRVIICLGVIIVLMQGVILYRQGNDPVQPVRPQLVRDAPKGAVIDLAGIPSKGSPQAKVILVEFSDFECPYCQRHFNTVGLEIERQYVDSNKLRVAFVNNPLPNHSTARLLASAAICAGDQEHYWEMHDALFRMVPTTKDAILSISGNIGLEPKKFSKCLDGSSGATAQIDHDIQKARALNLSATPSFALGRVDKSGRIQIEKLIQGALPIEIFQEAINKELS